MNFWGNFGRYGCVGVGLVGGGIKGVFGQMRAL